MTVVYILGSARSGSSLLSSLAGEMDGCFAAAETRMLWHGFDQRRCGCGRPVSECEVWADAIAHAATRMGDLDPDRVVALQRSSTRTRHVARILARRSAHHADADRYGRTLAELYQGLAAVTGARAIVDSSKAPAEAALLARSPGVDCRLVHLVRDPRAVAYSWDRVARRDPSLRRQSFPATAARWMATNLVAERVCAAAGEGRWLRVRYEDLVAHPGAELAAIARLAGVSAPGPDPDPARPRASRHMVGGNALRFGSERVAIRADTEWASAMPRGAIAGVTSMCWPLLGRYGYGLTPPRRHDAR